MDTLEGRVKRLERENRTLRLGAVLVLAAVGGVILMGQSPGPQVTDELRVRTLVIVDEAGKPRAGLTVLPGGVSSLALLDEAGGMRLALGLAKEGPSVVLSDEAGKGGVTLGMFEPGPVLTMQDREGRTVWEAP